MYKVDFLCKLKKNPGILKAIYFDEPIDISENFVVSYHCKNLKFRESQLKMVSMTHVGELQGYLNKKIKSAWIHN